MSDATQMPLPEGWRWASLGDVCEKQVKSYDPGKHPDKPFRYIDITSVDNQAKRITTARTLLGKEAPSRARQVIQAGDVLVSTTRPNLNAVAFVPDELDGELCSTGFCVLRAGTDIIPSFLFAFIQSSEFVASLSELVKGALYPAVTDGQVRNQIIPLPPIVEQMHIAHILTEQMAAVDRARAAAEEQLLGINALPAALLKQAFSGGSVQSFTVSATPDSGDSVEGENRLMTLGKSHTRSKNKAANGVDKI